MASTVESGQEPPRKDREGTRTATVGSLLAFAGFFTFVVVLAWIELDHPFQSGRSLAFFAGWWTAKVALAAAAAAVVFIACRGLATTPRHRAAGATYCALLALGVFVDGGETIQPDQVLGDIDREMLQLQDRLTAAGRAADEFRRTQQAFGAAGGVDWTSIRSTDDILGRLRKLYAMEEAATVNRLAQRSLLRTIDRRLTDGEPSEGGRWALADVRTEAETALSACRQHRVFIEAAKQQLDILRLHFGRWKIGGEPGRVVLQDPKAMESFRKLESRRVQAERNLRAEAGRKALDGSD